MLMAFDQIYYTYPCTDQPAVNNLSLQIPAGKRCVFIGQNGCGKTTLFRLANGLYQPQQGVIRWRGECIQYNRRYLHQLRQQVGLVFQNPEQQLVATTVEEDLSYGLFNFGFSEAEIRKRVEQALIDFDLRELADYPVNYLSLGQKKRLAIADVMILQPQLLLLDEPTAYLDPKQVASLRQMLDAYGSVSDLRVQGTGTTIAIATHDLNFVYNWADWVFLIDQGKLILENSPEFFLQQPQLFSKLGFGIPARSQWET